MPGVFEGAFRLYDLDNNGTITRDEMLQIVKAIFSMVGNHAQFKDDDNTPEKRVDRIFALMDTVSGPKLLFFWPESGRLSWIIYQICVLRRLWNHFTIDLTNYSGWQWRIIEGRVFGRGEAR